MRGIPSLILTYGVIVLITILIQEFVSLLSCVAGINEAVLSMTILSVGMSISDIFIFRRSAKKSNNADSTLTFMLQSISTNLFFGVGSSWMINVLYYGV